MRTLIALPCMNTVETVFFKSMLELRPVQYAEFGITEATLIYDARNTLCKRAVVEGFDRVLFIDSDMIFEPDLMERLSADMDKGLDYVSGLYFKRRKPITPVIYQRVEYEPVAGREEFIPVAEPYEDYPKDALFQIAASGGGAVMISAKLITAVANRYGLPFAPMLGFGEDLSFCKRATELGFQLWCDSSIKLGHSMRTVSDEAMWEAGRA